MGNTLENIIIKKTGNLIQYDYKKNGKWNELLSTKEKLWIEYDENIEDVPNSIAIIPFLVNVLPIAWIYNLTISVDELDYTFYNQIESIKKGYEKMYPQISFKGNIIVTNKTKVIFSEKKSALLFSGGVDAMSSLINNIEMHPDLITIWGADVKLDDINGWEKISIHHKITAKDFGLKFHYIKSNFKNFISYSVLTKELQRYVSGEWWHEIQHGIGLIGLVAPLSYINKYKQVYIASSHTTEDIGNYTCASDPTIDNHLKYANCITIHDGFEFNRQDKIRNICNYVRNNRHPINLRVCWESDGGSNCSHCEKCYRTMLGIIAEKENPKNYGFQYNDKIRKSMVKELKIPYKYNVNQRYECIQKRLIENFKEKNSLSNLEWFKNVRMKNHKPKYINIYEKARKKLQRIYRK